MVLVVSNRKAAYGLERAQKAGKPTLYFPRTFYPRGARGGCRADRREFAVKPYEARREDYDRDLATEARLVAPNVWPRFLVRFVNAI